LTPKGKGLGNGVQLASARTIMHLFQIDRL
jgi:hypothetical protein